MSSGTQRKPKDEILKAMDRKRAKTEHLEIVLNGPRMASVREEVRAASKNDGKRQRRSRLACEARRHSKGDGKGDAKGKGPKRSQFVTRVKQFGVHPFFRRGNARRNPHAIIGIHQNAHTTNPKVDANKGIRVYSRSQAKPVTTNMAIQLWP